MNTENNENTTEVTEETTSEHSADNHGHSKPSYDDINTTAIILVGLISALFTFLTIVFVQGLYYKWSNSYIRERSTEYVNKPVKRIVDEQKSALNGDEAAGTISIEEAMEKALAKYGKSE